MSTMSVGGKVGKLSKKNTTQHGKPTRPHTMNHRSTSNPSNFLRDDFGLHWSSFLYTYMFQGDNSHGLFYKLIKCFTTISYTAPQHITHHRLAHLLSLLPSDKLGLYGNVMELIWCLGIFLWLSVDLLTWIFLSALFGILHQTTIISCENVC